MASASVAPVSSPGEDVDTSAEMLHNATPFDRQVTTGSTASVPWVSAGSTSSAQSHQDRARSALTLSDSDQLLRGMPMNSLLRLGATVLSNSKGSASSYDLSHQAGDLDLDIFLSHNWSISRLRKFFSLALWFNLRTAVIVASFVMVLCFSLQACGILPVPLRGDDYEWVRQEFNPEDQAEANAGIAVVMFTTPAFVLTLFFKHDVAHCISPGPVTFLDKTCIHQTDKELMKAGITKLGAFLAHSSQLVILYSDVYLTKLWTVYELSCFMMTRTNYDMQVIHTSIVPIFFVPLTYFYLWKLSYLVPIVSAIGDPVSLLLGLLGCAVFRRGHHHLKSTWEHLETFRVEDATCFDPADRPVVEGNIEAFLKCKGHIAWEATTADTMQVFNELVQSIVARAMKRSLGTSPLPLHLVVIMWSLTISAADLDVASALVHRYGMSDVKVWGLLFRSITFVMAGGITTELTNWIMSRKLHLTCCKEMMWVLLGAFCWMTCLSMVMTPLETLRLDFSSGRSSKSNGSLIAFGILNGLCWAAFASLCLWPSLQAKSALIMERRSKQSLQSEAGRSLHSTANRGHSIQIEQPEASAPISSEGAGAGDQNPDQPVACALGQPTLIE